MKKILNTIGYPIYIKWFWIQFMFQNYWTGAARNLSRHIFNVVLWAPMAFGVVLFLVMLLPSIHSGMIFPFVAFLIMMTIPFYIVFYYMFKQYKSSLEEWTIHKKTIESQWLIFINKEKVQNNKTVKVL